MKSMTYPEIETAIESETKRVTGNLDDYFSYMTKGNFIYTLKNLADKEDDWKSEIAKLSNNKTKITADLFKVYSNAALMVSKSEPEASHLVTFLKWDVDKSFQKVAEKIENLRGRERSGEKVYKNSKNKKSIEELEEIVADEIFKPLKSGHIVFTEAYNHFQKQVNAQLKTKNSSEQPKIKGYGTFNVSDTDDDSDSEPSNLPQRKK